MVMDFPWPIPPGASEKPVWTARGFRMGDTYTPILSYQVAASGWTEELTQFHEETAGGQHFIDRASRWHALQALSYLKSESPVIFDIGCSSGLMLRFLRERLPQALVVGSDFVRQPLDRLALAEPAIPLMQFDLVTCPLADDSVDAVILLNVLEHVEDDVAAMAQVYRILKPNGIAVIEVPANQRLYDVYDKVLMHCRRYSLRALRQMAESVGFRVLDHSHLGFFLYPAFWLSKMRNKRFLSRDNLIQQAVVARSIRSTGDSRILDALMRIELFFGRMVSYPFGIRCLITCVKM